MTLSKKVKDLELLETWEFQGKNVKFLFGKATFVRNRKLGKGES